jgi:hypothetical protein
MVVLAAFFLDGRFIVTVTMPLSRVTRSVSNVLDVLEFPMA